MILSDIQSSLEPDSETGPSPVTLALLLKDVTRQNPMGDGANRTTCSHRRYGVNQIYILLPWIAMILFVNLSYCYCSTFEDVEAEKHDTITHRIHVWYIYLHLPWTSTIHVGKYAIHGSYGNSPSLRRRFWFLVPMDHMGHSLQLFLVTTHGSLFENPIRSKPPQMDPVFFLQGRQVAKGGDSPSLWQTQFLTNMKHDDFSGCQTILSHIIPGKHAQ